MIEAIINNPMLFVPALIIALPLIAIVRFLDI